jgi:hypothetical protein
MDWNSLLTTIVFIGFLVMTIRGCGRMAGGGCGMRHGRGRDPMEPPATGPSSTLGEKIGV